MVGETLEFSHDVLGSHENIHVTRRQLAHKSPPIHKIIADPATPKNAMGRM